jgi:hypothetical protein
MEQYRSGNCTICTKYFSTLHWHHTVPRALGGEHSLQIPLCGDCHTTLHANADAIVAKINGGKSIKRIFWTRPGDSGRAEKWLGILVNAMLNPPDLLDKEYLISTKIDQKTHVALTQLKQMLGATNLQDVYLFCIATTLKQRGLYDEQRNTEHPKESAIRTKKPKADLW